MVASSVTFLGSELSQVCRDLNCGFLPDLVARGGTFGKNCFGNASLVFIVLSLAMIQGGSRVGHCTWFGDFGSLERVGASFYIRPAGLVLGYSEWL